MREELREVPVGDEVEQGGPVARARGGPILPTPALRCIQLEMGVEEATCVVEDLLDLLGGELADGAGGEDVGTRGVGGE